jgi:hypothetical protein
VGANFCKLVRCTRDSYSLLYVISSLGPGLVRAEILAMMGTFEESNRIVNDIKGRREPEIAGLKKAV